MLMLDFSLCKCFLNKKYEYEKCFNIITFGPFVGRSYIGELVRDLMDLKTK